MILRRTSRKDYSLDQEITLAEFISNVIEKDGDKEFKFYEIHILKKMSSQNMVLYYQSGNLKSHHTTFSKFDYEDYLNELIAKEYFCDYIRSDNIYSFDEDNNKKEREEERKRLEENLSDSIDDMFKEMEIESNRREIKNKFRWNKKDISDSDIKDVLRIIIEDCCELEDKYTELQSLYDHEIKSNKFLLESTKWLEYKIDLLTEVNKGIKEE